MPGKDFFDKQVSIQWVLGAIGTSLFICLGTVWSFSADWKGLNDKLDRLISQQNDSAIRTDKRIEQENALFAAHDNRLSVAERTIYQHDYRLDNVERVLQLKIPVRK